MVLASNIQEEFHTWLAQEVSEEEQAWILLELSWVDAYLYRRSRQHVFDKEEKTAREELKRLFTSRSFRKYIADTMKSLCHTTLDEYTTYEMTRLKSEQLETACDFYIRFLRRRIAHDPSFGIPMKRRGKRAAPYIGKSLEKRKLRREIKDFLSLSPEKAKRLRRLIEEGKDPFQDSELRTLCKVKVFCEIAKAPVTEKDALNERLPALLIEPMQEMLKEIEEEGLLFSRGEKWVFQPALIRQGSLDAAGYIEDMPNSRERLILHLRILGLSLKAIGDRLFITRERVRQIASRALDKRPPLAEDAWLPAWERYHGVGKKNFCYIFQLRENTVNYLNMVCGHVPAKKNRSLLLAEIAKDTTFPEEVRFRAARMHLS